MSDGPSIHPWLSRPDTDPAGRPELLEHLAACAICRARAAEHDPVTLFALCALEPVPEEVAERVSRGAELAIASAARRRRVGRAVSWAALAASLAAAGVFALFERGHVASPAPGRTAVVVEDTSPQASPASMIEVLDSPGTADVVEMAVGDAEVTIIFDKELPI